MDQVQLGQLLSVLILGNLLKEIHERGNCEVVLVLYRAYSIIDSWNN
jgi:hypothetical protein